ncbi:uncharacterized protein LOC120134706 [Hibiscus syriacus]|uniref:uncharacterized protein LOC120134706 n=1 Tax=Hibiscus syriacus TaxID=106335 RepID=UPI0019250B45|nr:uncharacterized protein LOC120134706 [Hibiscus syriacus]
MSYRQSPTCVRSYRFAPPSFQAEKMICSLTGVYASAVPGYTKSDPSRRKSISSSSSASRLVPLFRVSSEPDYIDSYNRAEFKERSEGELEMDPPQKLARSKFYPGSFTDEKAKQLRLMITRSSSLHDVMYHSAIASRPASDFKGRSGL